MRNVAINSLGYTGIVTLSQYAGKTKKILKKIKNSGGASLFNFLSDCFTGDFSTAAVNRPTKIMLLQKHVDEESYDSASSFIYLLTKPEKIFNPNGGSTICYSFIIPREYLNNEFNCIGLYPDSAVATASDIDNYSAICEVDTGDIPMSASTVLVVDWELTIANQVGEADNATAKK